MRVLERTIARLTLALFLLLLAAGCRLQKDSETPNDETAAADEDGEEGEEEEEKKNLPPGENNATHITDGRIISPTYHPEGDDSPLPFWGHIGEISAVTFNVRGDFVFTAAPNEPVYAWEVRTGFPTRRFEGVAGGRITGMAVDLDDKLLAVGDSQGLSIWSVETGALHRRFDLPDARQRGGSPATVTAVGQVFEENLAVLGDNHGRLMLIDIRDGHVEQLYDTGLGPIRSVVGGVEWVAASGSRSTIVLDRRRDPSPLPLHGELKSISLWDLHATIGALIGTDGYTIFRWGPDFQAPPQAYVGPSEGIRAFASDSAGRRGIILTRDNHIELRILPEGKVVKRFDAGPRRPRTALASDVWGEYMVSTDTMGVLTWPFAEKKVERFLYNAPSLHSVRFVQGSHNIITAGEDRVPIIYNLDHPTELIRYVDYAPDPIVQGLPHAASNVYYTSTTGGEIVVYALRAGKIVETLKLNAGDSPLLALDKHAERLAIAPSTREGSRPANGERVLIWDISSNDVEADLPVHSDIVDLEFGPTRDLLYYLTRSAEIESWNIDTDHRQRQFDDFNSVGHFLRVDPLGTLIAVGGDEGIGFYNARLDFLSGVALGPVKDLAFSPDGRWAVAATVTGALYTLRFDDSSPVTVEPLVQLPSAPTSIDISDDSQLVAVSELRGAVSMFLNDPDAELLEPHATLLLLPFGQWLVYLPNKAYFGSELAERVLFFDGENGRVDHLLGAGVTWGRSERTIEDLSLRSVKPTTDSAQR